MSAASNDLTCELLAQSLIAWRLAGRVERMPDGRILVICNAIDISIERAPPSLPFRWMVTVGQRKRAAISLPAVLRQVREALDPDYARNKVRVAVAPEHDPEKWAPVFGKDHAQTKSLPS